MVDATSFNLTCQVYLIDKLVNESDDSSLPASQKRVKVDMANDGSVAIQMVKDALSRPCHCHQKVYKLIIMDLQMQ